MTDLIVTLAFSWGLVEENNLDRITRRKLYKHINRELFQYKLRIVDQGKGKPRNPFSYGLWGEPIRHSDGHLGWHKFYASSGSLTTVCKFALNVIHNHGLNAWIAKEMKHDAG